MAFPLSVLDLSPIDAGLTSSQALQNTVNLAIAAERLGYTRYWLAEHHNSAMLASSSPEILIGHVAQATSRMHIGSGGVMLPNHSPLKVAENFRVLEALHPGRIDLGIGRAPGTDPTTARALRRSRVNLGEDDFPEQLAELFAFTSSPGFPQGHPFQKVTAMPMDRELPPVWLLGSSDYSASAAAALGLGFSFAHHINPQAARAATRLYQEEFQPSAFRSQPHTIIATSVICADTEEQVADLTEVMKLTIVKMRTGRSGPLPSPAEAYNHVYEPIELLIARQALDQRIIGTPKIVKPLLDELIEQTHADELMITAIVYGHENRLRLYEILAELFQIGR